MRAPGPLDREILRLAVPAFGALVAEPAFLLADSVVVGTLGTEPLAGLGLAGSLLATAIGVFVFLAYATTASVARQVGADDPAGAVGSGVDGMWLALGLGAVTSVLTWAAAPGLVEAFNPSPAVAEQAVTYLRWSLPGLPAMLVVLAATGVLRGLQDTLTPLWVAVGGAVLNAALNVVLVIGLDVGIAGSAAGTSAAQLVMALVLVAVVVRGARRVGAGLRPRGAGVLRSARTGVPLLVRTLTLRAALLITTYVATAAGDAALAAHQVAMTVWTLLAFALDAVAIAGQAITGRALGAGDVVGTRAATDRMVRWGVGVGVVLGAMLLAVHRIVAPLFTADPAVAGALAAALVVVALSQPLAGYVFVLDGVLIGAGDGAYLARAGLGVLVTYLPLAGGVLVLAPGGASGLVWLWVAFAVGFMAARALTLGVRARQQVWLVTGAIR